MTIQPIAPSRPRARSRQSAAFASTAPIRRDRLSTVGVGLVVGLAALVAAAVAGVVVALGGVPVSPASWLVQGSPALWYLNRATGLVVLVLLTLVTVLGVMSTARRTPSWWARFATVDLHRRASALAVTLLVVHVGTAVLDSYVPIAWSDAFVPFQSQWRPLWLGLGTVAVDLWLAVVLSSLVRRRLSLRAWKAVHLLAYVAWVPAVFHGLGSGTDVHGLPGMVLTFACVAAVAVAGAWRAAVSSLGVLLKVVLGAAAVVAPVVLLGMAP